MKAAEFVERIGELRENARASGSGSGPWGELIPNYDDRFADVTFAQTGRIRAVDDDWVHLDVGHAHVWAFSIADIARNSNAHDRCDGETSMMVRLVARDLRRPIQLFENDRARPLV